MRILSRVDGSVLWLLQDNEHVVANLRSQAAARNVDPNRLVFAPRMPLADHLARHRVADLFLDTLPYNAHTTASDALWVGLPVLTLLGESFAGRVAASLLRAEGIPELIAADPQSYEQLAIELAGNPEKLAAVRQKLAGNRLTTPLFDTELYARHLDAAYIAMFERYKAGAAPEHIEL
jgi:predicted O-linked N-acetylglucosamine transferase (SPINDLY family)